MLKNIALSFGLLLILAACGDDNCSSDFISDYNSTFVYNGGATRAQQCSSVRSFKSKWSGTECTAAEGSSSNKTTVNADSRADSVLQQCI